MVVEWEWRELEEFDVEKDPLEGYKGKEMTLMIFVPSTHQYLMWFTSSLHGYIQTDITFFAAGTHSKWLQLKGVPNE